MDDGQKLIDWLADLGFSAQSESTRTLAVVLMAMATGSGTVSTYTELRLGV